MIAAKISSRHPARNPFGPRKIWFSPDSGASGGGSGALPEEEIPGGVIAPLSSGATKPNWRSDMSEYPPGVVSDASHLAGANHTCRSRKIRATVSPESRSEVGKTKNQTRA